MTSLWTRFNSLMLVLVFLALVGVLGMLARDAYGGPLDPPAGTPGPTMKTLQQVEPRTPISSIPFQITQPGSYYVTQNLTLVAFAGGIDLQSDDVTIDLNGFTLDGANFGTNGIFDGGTQRSITIRNGTFVRWGRAIDLSFTEGARVEDVEVRTTLFGGIEISNGTLSRCSVHFAGVNNGGPGVQAIRSTVEDCVVVGTQRAFELTSSTLRSCVVSGSTQVGITAIDSHVEGCYLTGNAVGIDARESIIRNNVVSASQQDGIRLLSGSGRNTVSDNLVRGSGTQAGAPGAHGIFATTNGNRISQNHVVATNGRGIRVEGSYNMIDGNDAFENSVSQAAPGGMGFYILGAENTVVRNSAGFNLTNGVTQNYSIGGGNNDAPVQPPASATNPLANTE